MPKNRLLSDVIILSQKINSVSEGAENLYYRILVSVDDYGHYHADPQILKGKVCTLRRISIQQISKRLGELVKSGLIKIYPVNGENYLEVVDFERFQRFRSDIKRTGIFPEPVTYTDESVTDCNESDTSRNEKKQEVELYKSKSKEKEKREKSLIKEVIDIFNNITGQKRTYTNKETNDFILGRINEGRTVDDFKEVIAKKHSQWRDDKKMCVYIRPSTLFRPGNFDDYLNEKIALSNKDKLEAWAQGKSNVRSPI